MRKILLSGALLLGLGTTTADVPASFLEFRQGILDDFQEFRRTILDHYADFLEGTWHEYEPLEPLKRDETPKPISVPKVSLKKPSVTPKEMPAPILGTIPDKKPAEPVKVDPEPETPAGPGGLLDKPKTVIPPEALKEVPTTLKVKPDPGSPMLAVLPPMPEPLPEPVAEPVAEPIKEVPEIPVVIPKEESRAGKEPVNFYGMEILVPQIDFKISNSLGQVSDLSRHWKILDEQDVAERLEEALAPKLKELGLNDYLTYEFLCAYVDSKFPQAGLMPKMSLVHYMLANMGYNARIAVATKTGEPILLLPSKQTLYGKVYMTMGGEKFYVMNNVSLKGTTISTCDLPKGANSGKKFDLQIKGLNLPMKERRFEVNHGNLHLAGTLNENLMPIVYRYPQMDTKDFAVSVLDKNLRKDLVRQVKEQIGGMDKLKATNELLQFVQFGFDYATDDAFHGFEKPYFLEENLYYPKNDCEDRAIFYTYMLWNALGVESQLLFFPGHESASVALPGEDVRGTSYMDEGKRYYISDPTYVGSYTGMCMPQFETTAPKIDHSYK